MRDAAIVSVSAKQALRSRLVVVVSLVFLAIAAALAYGATGDGSAVGRLRAFLSWSTGFQILVLSVTAVFLATSLSRGLTQGELVPVLTGPLPRWRVLLGWWVGVVLVLAALTVASQAIVGGLSALMLSREPARTREVILASLAARGVATPPPLDRASLRANAEAGYAQLVAEGAAPPELSREEAVELLMQRRELNRRTVRPRGSKTWTLTGVRPSPDALRVTLRFRYLPQAAPGQLAEGEGPLGRWHVRRAGTQQWFSGPPGSWSGGEVHEQSFPAELIRGGDSIELYYESLEERPIAIVFPEGSVQLLFPAGSYLGNLVRGGLLLLGRLLFLAALGVTLGSLIEGRLAALVVLFCVAIGAANAFLTQSLRPTLFGPLDDAIKAVLHGVLLLLPNMSEVDLSTQLAAGERIELRDVARTWLLDGVVRGGACLLLGSALFHRRELGSLR